MVVVREVDVLIVNKTEALVGERFARSGKLSRVCVSRLFQRARVSAACGTGEPPPIFDRSSFQPSMQYCSGPAHPGYGEILNLISEQPRNMNDALVS